MFGQALIQQLKRIADALEVQNSIYLGRCAQSDKNDLEYQQRHFKHDFELVEAQQATRTEQLKLERENMLLVRKLYDEHPNLAQAQIKALEAYCDD